jgi:hypothetical protein
MAKIPSQGLEFKPKTSRVGFEEIVILSVFPKLDFPTLEETESPQEGSQSHLFSISGAPLRYFSIWYTLMNHGP